MKWVYPNKGTKRDIGIESVANTSALLKSESVLIRCAKIRNYFYHPVSHRNAVPVIQRGGWGHDDPTVADRTDNKLHVSSTYPNPANSYGDGEYSLALAGTIQRVVVVILFLRGNPFMDD